MTNRTAFQITCTQERLSALSLHGLTQCPSAVMPHTVMRSCSHAGTRLHDIVCVDLHPSSSLFHSQNWERTQTSDGAALQP